MFNDVGVFVGVFMGVFVGVACSGFMNSSRKVLHSFLSQGGGGEREGSYACVYVSQELMIYVPGKYISLTLWPFFWRACTNFIH